MYTKRNRVRTWVILASMSLVLGGTIALFAEVFYPNSLFHRTAMLIFQGGSFLYFVGILLAFGSLALNDWQETQSAKNFVNLGHDDDRVISVYERQNSILHLPVSGTTHQMIVAPTKKEVPYVTDKITEHVHITYEVPNPTFMEDDLYQQLFGLSNN